ncbi:YggT family protein [Acetobacterium paludosum]|uniref:YggT family protein n=2 Tax=Acetobacterium TaxID=33951 RepID=A0A923KP06_9FIRM|nr:YggT family protein [Acetobacterium tundrae]MBC3887644.1 YggT family protein [Acetobacterium paludosum]
MLQGIFITAGYYLFELITVLIFVNIVFSWVRPDPDNIIVKTIYGLTEPILSPLRRFTVFGPIDFSPFAAILLLQMVFYPLYQKIITLIF